MTEEELEQRILEYRKSEGYSINEIAKKFHRKFEWVQRREEKLKQKGLLTEKDIKKAEKERQIREFLTNPITKEVLKLKEDGISDNGIAKVLHIPQQKVSRYVKKALGLGLLEKTQIDEARKRAREEKSLERDILIEEERKQEKDEDCLMNYLVMGYDLYRIKRKMKMVSIDNCRKAIDVVIKKGKITEKEIQKYQEKRKQEEKAIVLEELKKGTAESKIVKIIDNTLYSVKEYVKEIQEDKKVEIETKIKLKEELSEEEIRDYVNWQYKKYEKEPITKNTLSFLRQQLQEIPIQSRDIFQFVKLAISIGEYQEGLDFIRGMQEIKGGDFSDKEKQKLEKLEKTLSKANKVQQALQIIRKGNTNTAVISNVTNLSKDEVNLLKIRVVGKPIRIAGPNNRRSILDILVTDKDPVKIQKETGITDFEMDDMVEQMLEYRHQLKQYKQATSETEKREIQEQIAKDTRTRVVVLYTKLGRDPEFIAKILKRDPEKIKEDLSYAIDKKIIEKEQLQGIDPLVCYRSQLREQITL